MIDDHVHPFPLEFAPLEPASVSLDVGGDPGAAERRRRQGPGRLFAELLTTKLAHLLGAPVDEVIAVRDEAARADWAGHLRRLFDDAGITGFVLDDGIAPGPQTPLDTYRGLAGRPVWRLARVDPVVDELVGNGSSTREVLAGVETFMAEAAASGAVGFKTIVAYRTGLAVAPDPSLAEAERSLDPAVPVRRRGKALRDLVARRMLAVAAELGRPVQFHTGFGDSEIRLGESNPLLLEELLRTPEGKAASVVLIHGSFPWHEEAAYLATTKPNVWVELSLSNLFAPLHTADRVQRLVELAPREKVLTGSDGHGPPETHWFGCRMLLEAWPSVAGRLAEAGARPGWIEETRLAIFEGNARTVYGLS